jgi:pimeloyl-ACP methyl ester carboxylesterase
VFVSLIKIGVLAYLGIAAYLYLAQRSLMYFPTPEVASGDVAFEYLESDGLQLKLWTVGDSQARRALIYFGGNAENVYFNADYFRNLFPQHRVYLVNYRGYGGSEGEPTERGLFADALRIFDLVDSRHDSVAVIGRSLGSAVAVYLASQRPAERLLLATPPDSVVALAQSMYPLFPVGWLLKDRYESVRYAAGVTVPTKVLIAEHDRIVPPRHSLALVAAFDATPVEYVTIEAAGHNGLSNVEQYWREMREFLHR